MFLSEIETLRRLRRHRAERAERTLRDAKRLQGTLQDQVHQAHAALDQARQQAAQKTAELVSRHQGQVVSLQDLKTWGNQERRLLAGTAREEGELRELYQRQQRQVTHVETAQRQVTECLREVEKLQELAHLLAQEAL
ncbi:type III secretion system stalk subunit SctO [Pseudomonas mucidolens]|uniref:Type III secretion protein YscO n=1 Tax=Pseudomonas mucidolens TaxID=46679 RepID=A0A1H2NGY8_9PSED|nr:YscO family type III secretion system apparatus protein [Pseudomonas mucidolens]SDV04693.1 Type III secretion protein YscO [Pseudomonas mucidolens]SQH31945.1 type III secretion protein RspO [Pseudomonas mucidolens]